MRSSLVCLLAVAGCAKGSTSHLQADAPPGTDDAPIDSPMTDSATPDSPMHDAAMPDTFVPDAFVPDAFVPDAFVPDAAMPDASMPDAMIDAPMADAPTDACVPAASELLVNPSLDLSPMGTGWQQTVIDPAAPLITDEDGIVEQSAPYKIWLGGITAANVGQSVTDVVWQDVTVPAGTTQLTLTYYVAVGTTETTATVAYDTASIAITQTNGTLISNINSYSNLTPIGAWTQVSFNVPQNLSGQTIRLRLTSSNDFSNVTSFYFDSFTFTATHCP